MIANVMRDHTRLVNLRGSGVGAIEATMLDGANPGAVVVGVTSEPVSGTVLPVAFGPLIRAYWEVRGGGTQSFTFSVVAYAQQQEEEGNAGHCDKGQHTPA